MLQIASGKLFGQGQVRSNDLRGVAYTNLVLYDRDPVETVAGRLLATYPGSQPGTVVYEVTERIEEAVSPGVVSHGIEPYLLDFSAVVSFALNVTCTPDSELAARLTDPRAKSLAAPDR